eukprot:5915426-Amphidinium_carterae.2
MFEDASRASTFTTVGVTYKISANEAPIPSKPILLFWLCGNSGFLTSSYLANRVKLCLELSASILEFSLHVVLLFSNGSYGTMEVEMGNNFAVCIQLV